MISLCLNTKWRYRRQWVNIIGIVQCLVWDSRESGWAGKRRGPSTEEQRLFWAGAKSLRLLLIGEPSQSWPQLWTAPSHILNWSETSDEVLKSIYSVFLVYFLAVQFDKNNFILFFGTHGRPTPVQFDQNLWVLIKLSPYVPFFSSKNTKSLLTLQHGFTEHIGNSSLPNKF